MKIRSRFKESISTDLISRDAAARPARSQVSFRRIQSRSLFDNYIVESSGSVGRRSSAACEISVPMQVPMGYQMTFGRIDYRGFAHEPEQGRTVLNGAAFFKDPFLKTFKHPVRCVANAKNGVVAVKVRAEIMPGKKHPWRNLN